MISLNPFTTSPLQLAEQIQARAELSAVTAAISRISAMIAAGDFNGARNLGNEWLASPASAEAKGAITRAMAPAQAALASAAAQPATASVSLIPGTNLAAGAEPELNPMTDRELAGLARQAAMAAAAPVITVPTPAVIVPNPPAATTIADLAPPMEFVASPIKSPNVAPGAVSGQLGTEIPIYVPTAEPIPAPVGVTTAAPPAQPAVGAKAADWWRRLLAFAFPRRLA
jgi:hypothetical protein